MRFFCTALLGCLVIAAAVAGPNNCRAESGNGEPGAAAIISRLESRYGGADIAAEFSQESTLKVLDITDTATGKVWFKHPGMMRWEYEAPDPHAIITDGQTLWIYRPQEQQVVVGDALEYFGNGKGASFLSNITLLKKQFRVEKSKAEESGFYSLELTPEGENLDLKKIFLRVDKKDYLVRQVLTENIHGDITRITFKNISFPEELSVSRFAFDIPAEADVIKMQK
ncbi:MAG: outer membrane lipoprotein chaperone LolA [Desulfosalsimonadaceae bacterium]